METKDIDKFKSMEIGLLAQFTDNIEVIETYLNEMEYKKARHYCQSIKKHIKEQIKELADLATSP